MHALTWQAAGLPVCCLAASCNGEGWTPCKPNASRGTWQHHPAQQHCTCRQVPHTDSHMWRTRQQAPCARQPIRRPDMHPELTAQSAPPWPPGSTRRMVPRPSGCCPAMPATAGAGRRQQSPSWWAAARPGGCQRGACARRGEREEGREVVWRMGLEGRRAGKPGWRGAVRQSDVAGGWIPDVRQLTTEAPSGTNAGLRSQPPLTARAGWAGLSCRPSCRAGRPSGGCRPVAAAPAGERPRGHPMWQAGCQ